MSALRTLIVLVGLVVGGMLYRATFHQSQRAPSILLPKSPAAQAAAASPAPTPFDPNVRDAEGRSRLALAVQQRDRAQVEHLLAAKADLELADSEGVTPLMFAAVHGDVVLLRLLAQNGARLAAVDAAGRTAAHHAVLAREAAALAFLLETEPSLATPTADGPDLLTMAASSGKAELLQPVLERAPANLPWTDATRHALLLSLQNNQPDLSRLLLAKHAGPPTAVGSSTPLLAWSIATDDTELFRQLLAVGADPNTTLPTPPEKNFLTQVKSDNFRGYAREDQGVTVLMLAAALGKSEYLRALLDAGAERNRQTARYKMLALYFAARTQKPQCVQMLLGRGPSPDQLRVEISLATQRASVIKNGVPILQTAISTGRKGFATPSGQFVVTDKNRDHRSSIYKVPMPFFMRLNCLDFGLHAGVVPNYPASHGCIRLPADVAQKLFSEIPVGTMVTIN